MAEEHPESISRAVASLPPEQMFELMKQMKLCIKNSPDDANSMLLQNPQLSFALLQAQTVMHLIDPLVAWKLLNAAPNCAAPTSETTISPPQIPVQALPTSSTDSSAAPTTFEVSKAAQVVATAQAFGHENLARTSQSAGLLHASLSFSPDTSAMVAEQAKGRDPRGVGRGAGTTVQAPPPTNLSAVSAQDQEKAVLLMQVLQLSQDQISSLPTDQQNSILLLRQQLHRSVPP
uniref:cleavage stimulation factor subunit 2-like n=1 Tax=Myxine glutinosa TaxID=7769 RepID=UPI00358FBB31